MKTGGGILKAAAELSEGRWDQHVLLRPPASPWLVLCWCHLLAVSPPGWPLLVLVPWASSTAEEEHGEIWDGCLGGGRRGCSAGGSWAGSPGMAGGSSCCCCTSRLGLCCAIRDKAFPSCCQTLLSNRILGPWQQQNEFLTRSLCAVSQQAGAKVSREERLSPPGSPPGQAGPCPSAGRAPRAAVWAPAGASSCRRGPGTAQHQCPAPLRSLRGQLKQCRGCSTSSATGTRSRLALSPVQTCR